MQGYSNRYNGTGADMGRSIWLYNGAATLDIGLTDAERTQSDGYRFNSFFSDSTAQLQFTARIHLSFSTARGEVVGDSFAV